VEGIIEDLQHEFREDDLEADCDSPGVDDEAELGYFSEAVSVGLLAHLAVGTDFESHDES
jgi:hypothetical protein